MSLLDVNLVARRSRKALKAVASATCDLTAATTRTSDDFSRKVYCVLGIPIDAIDMTAACVRLKLPPAAATFLLSTANLNF